MSIIGLVTSANLQYKISFEEDGNVKIHIDRDACRHDKERSIRRRIDLEDNELRDSKELIATTLLEDANGKRVVVDYQQQIEIKVGNSNRSPYFISNDVVSTPIHYRIPIIQPL